MKLINNITVEKTIFSNLNKYLNYIKVRLKDIADDNSPVWIKDKIIYDDPFNQFGDVRPMTCFTEYVKMVKVISTNPVREKDPNISVGTVMSLDLDENYPIALYDATALSSIRTAAMAIISVEWMVTPPWNEDIIVLGYGQIGKYIERMINVRLPDSNARFMDLNEYNANDVFNAGVIITATNSKSPILNVDNCNAKYIVSVGADTHFYRELNDDLFKTKSYCVDVMDAYYVGDLEHIGTERIITNDLLQMLRKKIKPEMFISVGSPLMDALTVEYLSKNGT